MGIWSFEETFPSSIRENLWVLFGAVGLLLLIACANVSNLLLSKATERQKEMTVRAALGASRAGIVRQLLVESLVVAAAAGILGVALAAVGLNVILSLVPPDTIPDEAEIALNTPVLLFSFAISVVTSVVFGLAPALYATSSDLVSSLRETSRSVTGGRWQAFLRKALVVAEVALSLVLLVAAGLLIRTSLAVENVDVGFRTERVLAMRVPVAERRYPDRERRVAFFQDLIGRLSAMPGVESVGVNTGVHPFGGLNAAVEVAGGQPDTRPSLIHQTSADYAKALGIRLLQGRFYSASDVERGLPLALVNQAFARARLDGQSPLGRTIRIPRLSQPPFNIPATSFEIIGIVGDTVNRGVTNEVGPEVYVPYTLAGRADRVVILARSDVGSITKPALAAGLRHRHGTTGDGRDDHRPRACRLRVCGASFQCGAVHGVCRARPGPRGGGRLQRDGELGRATSTRSGRAHGARRQSGFGVRDGRRPRRATHCDRRRRRSCRERARGARARELRVACLDRRPPYAQRRLPAPPRHGSSSVRVAGSTRLPYQPNHCAQDRLTPSFTIREAGAPCGNRTPCYEELDGSGSFRIQLNAPDGHRSTCVAIVTESAGARSIHGLSLGRKTVGQASRADSGVAAEVGLPDDGDLTIGVVLGHKGVACGTSKNVAQSCMPHPLPPPIPPIFSPIPDVLPAIADVFAPVPNVLEMVATATNVTTILAIFETIPPVFASVTNVLAPVSNVFTSVWREPAMPRAARPLCRNGGRQSHQNRHRRGHSKHSHGVPSSFQALMRLDRAG